MPAIDPLAGQYPPGAAFTIVSTEALLAKGVTVNTPIPCTPVNTVGGHNFRNVPPKANADMGATLGGDFAQSCATAFAGLSLRLNTADLSKAATGFGFGQTVAVAADGVLRNGRDRQRCHPARRRHHRPGERQGEPAHHGGRGRAGGHRHLARADAGDPPARRAAVPAGPVRRRHPGQPPQPHARRRAFGCRTARERQRAAGVRPGGNRAADLRDGTRSGRPGSSATAATSPLPPWSSPRRPGCRPRRWQPASSARPAADLPPGESQLAGVR